VGVLIGHSAKGAIIGAAVGGTAGALIGRHMDKQAEELAREIPGARVERVGEGIAVSFESGILFPFDSAELQADGRDNLRKLADSLQENQRTEVMVVGHTDGVGSADYNQGLSERRARAASSYLAREGVTQDRLRPAGRGENEPIAGNDSEEGRRLNRRVEIAIFANSEWREDARRQAALD
jgi:outer membrane protein OmpA-like peptidoglycan-associated protein